MIYFLMEEGMSLISINWLAVLVCVIISMASGSLWYNPKTFFDIWWRGIGKTENDDPGSKYGMTIVWILTVLSSLVQAIFMNLAVSITGIVWGGPNLLTGALTGLFIWAGFIAPTYMVNKLFAGQDIKIWAIETGNHLVNFVIFGAVFGLWH
ncbi:MAG: DUF1761 domain-containing protein [Anaerolineae bacterium]|nr:DUF1761 domain-containing protein [Anaerolineae bacterium]